MEKAKYVVLGVLFYALAVPLGLVVMGFMAYAILAIYLSLLGAV